MNAEPWWWKANPKGLGSLPVPWSGYATAIIVGFLGAHLLIWEYTDHHQNVISSSYAPSIKFHPNPFITFWVMLSTNKQTDKPMLPKT